MEFRFMPFCLCKPPLLCWLALGVEVAGFWRNLHLGDLRETLGVLRVMVQAGEESAVL
jgi:hypothetical protein